MLKFLRETDRRQVLIEGQELGALTEKELRGQRSDIAMIFQNFNLLMQRVYLTMYVSRCRFRERKGKRREKERENC